MKKEGSKSDSNSSLIESISESKSFKKSVELLLENGEQLTTAHSLSFFLLYPEIQLVAFKGEKPTSTLTEEIQKKSLKDKIKRDVQAAFPFYFEGYLFGVLELSWDGPPPPEELNIVEALCSHTLSGLESVKKYEELKVNLEKEISEHQNLEKVLQESMEKYRNIVEQASDGVAIIQDTLFKYINPQLVEMSGYSPEEMVGTSFTDYIHPDELAAVVDRYQRRMAGEKVEPIYETVVLRKDGSPVSVEINAGLATYRGAPADFVIIRDISERKRIGEQLQKSEEKFRNLIELAPDGIVTLDLKGIITSCNTATAALTGYSKDEIIGKHIAQLKFLQAKDIPTYIKAFHTTVRGGAPELPEVTWVHKNGTPHVAEIRARLIKEGKKAVGLLVTTRDITERKQAEEKLKESEEKYRTIVELAPDAIITIDLKGIITSCNTAFLKLTGFSRADIMGKHFTKLPTLRVRDMPKYLKLFSSILRGKVPDPLEVTWINKDGAPRLAEGHAGIVKKGGKIKGFQVMIRDITERKKTEEMLQQSEEKYRTLIEDLNVGVYRAAPGAEGKFIDVNQAFAEMLGYTKEEILKLKVSDIYVNPQDRMRFSEKIITQGFAKNEELYLKKKDRTPIIISDTATPVYDRNGTLLYFDGISEDITQRKKAEERIKASLREKEVLLREIHHRVKNNMQVISSLLSLQSRYVKDAHLVEAFKESQNRIKSMALVHEKLYHSGDLASIDFHEYIKSLMRNLFQSYETAGRVDLTVQVKNVSLGVDVAIPCGLIINELVSNSLKHAFPEPRRGKISISLRQSGEDEIELVVADDGVGVPEDIDLKNITSLGLHLVTILAEDQLEGTISLKRTGGTEFCITFRAS